MAQSTIVALFDTLYPTWRLKHAALDSLLASVSAASADVGRGRLLGVIMNALAARSDIAMFLETAGSASESSDPAPAKESDGTGGVACSQQHGVVRVCLPL